MDPLSDVLALLKPRNLMSAGFEAGGDWSIRFPEQRDAIKTGAVVSGHCWLVVEDGTPIRLGPGDCFLLPTQRAFRVASDPALPSVDAGDVFPQARRGGVVSYSGGGDFAAVSSRFALEEPQAEWLLGTLPSCVIIRTAPERAMLRESMERMMEELREARPGHALIVQHLAQMILVQTLRLHLEQGGGSVGWLSALADRRMSAALTAVHADPAHRWTLDELARIAGMSRSAFAARFKEAVGASPMDYLARWRMHLAGERLATSRDSISVVALAAGYQSESAFSTAFKRVMGCAPRAYAGRQREVAGI